MNRNIEDLVDYAEDKLREIKSDIGELNDVPNKYEYIFAKLISLQEGSINSVKRLNINTVKRSNLNTLKKSRNAEDKLQEIKNRIRELKRVSEKYGYIFEKLIALVEYTINSIKKIYNLNLPNKSRNTMKNARR